MENELILRNDFEERMRRELAIPFWSLKSPQQKFTEAEFQEMKAQLKADIKKYAEDYIDPADNSN
jgi:hypothetical protein